MDKNEKKHFIAKRAAQEIEDGSVVILGIGIPLLCSEYIHEDLKICACSDGCVIAEDSVPEEGEENSFYVTNSGGGMSNVEIGGSFTDQATYFGLIRGGHIDTAILGCLQCDAEGNVASWLVPDKRMPGMGGSMDICMGTENVIITTEHTTKGKKKILEKCTMPLTAVGCVKTIITEMGFMSVTENGIVLREINPEYTPDEVQEQTGAHLIIPSDLKDMEV